MEGAPLGGGPGNVVRPRQPAPRDEDMTANDTTRWAETEPQYRPGGGVRSALRWLMAEADRISYGEVGVMLVVHERKVTRIERRSTEKEQVLSKRRSGRRGAPG